MPKFSEQEIERVSQIVRRMFAPEDCGSIPYDEYIRRTAILFLEMQATMKQIAGQQDRFGREVV